MKHVKKVLWVLIGTLVIVQFVRIDTTNPPADPALDLMAAANPPQEIYALIRTACYDCHSNETVYPWYSNIAPVSWWLKNHINEGREEFNFSTLGTLSSENLLDALASAGKEIKEGEMPLKSYTWLHGGAKLSDTQRNMLAQWLQSGGTNPAGTREEDEKHSE